MRGAGRVVFAAMMLLIVGTLNIIYGIGALDDANIFVNDTRFVLEDLNTLGWVLIILGIIQLTGGFSLMAGNAYGRVLGIIAGSVGAIGALLSIGGAFPWWSLAVFALCVYIVHGIVVYGEDETVGAGRPVGVWIGARCQAGLLLAHRQTKGTQEMIAALLVALGVELIVIVLFMGSVQGRKRWIKRQPGSFAGAIRVTSGELDGFDEKWKQGYGRWVRDVLVWTKDRRSFATKSSRLTGSMGCTRNLPTRSSESAMIRL